MSTNSKHKKSNHTLRTVILRILMAVCLAVFAFSAWKLYGIWSRSHQVEQETETLRQYLQTPEAQPQAPAESAEAKPQPEETFTVDWAGLRAANPNVVAWLSVPGTGISYPVVQGSDNSYYLNHTFNGQYNYLGAVFLDAAANPDFQDDNSIIYGHSVDIGGMFTELKDFTSLEFFESHPYFWILTPAQNYRCEIAAFYRGSDESAIYTIEFGDYENEVMQQIYQEAMYTRTLDLAGKRFVTLSTCNLDYGFQSNQRYVVMGMLEPWNDPIPMSAVQQ